MTDGDFLFEISLDLHFSLEKVKDVNRRIKFHNTYNCIELYKSLIGNSRAPTRNIKLWIEITKRELKNNKEDRLLILLECPEIFTPSE